MCLTALAAVAVATLVETLAREILLTDIEIAGLFKATEPVHVPGLPEGVSMTKEFVVKPLAETVHVPLKPILQLVIVTDCPAKNPCAAAETV